MTLLGVILGLKDASLKWARIAPGPIQSGLLSIFISILNKETPAHHNGGAGGFRLAAALSSSPLPGALAKYYC